MGDRPNRTEQAYPSTTYEWRRVKITRRTAAPSKPAPKGHRFSGLSAWRRREPLTLTVKYRGGPEGWIEVRARGRVAMYPGSLYVLDVLQDVWQDGHTTPRSS